jgi:acyl-coenzyme A synthetase/AMP-(fatty) acid ligase
MRVKLVQVIDFWAKQKPDAAAVVMLDTVISYLSLSRAIRGVAGHLAQKKLDVSAPVGILVDNPARNIVLNLALMSLGVPSMVIREAQLPYLGKLGTKTLLVEGQISPVQGLAPVQIDPRWFGDPNAPQPVALGSAERTKLAFTSGTTGIPKAISFTEEDIAARSNFLRVVTGDVNWTRSLIMPGLSTNFAFSQVALTLEFGRTVSFAPNPEDAARTIELFGIDLLVCSNQQAQSIVDHLETRKLRLRSLKCVWLGGAVPTEGLLQKINDYLCRDVLCVYASTEAHVAAFGRWHGIKHVKNAVGFICPWASVECVDAQGNPVPPGQEGDVRIKTPHQGLLHAATQDPAEQIETWFYPGDRGKVTSDGLLVIEGRATDTINKGGVKISAMAVEQCLLAVPGIEDAAVCGVPNRLGLDELVALVVSKSAIGAELLNAALSRAKVEATIDRVVMTDKIPRNATGKVNREDIRALARSRPN